MIKKLKQRIFLLVMLSLSIVMLGIIILYAYLNYTNTITISMMNRFIGTEPRRDSNALEDFKIRPEFDIDGLYRIIIQNSTIIHSSGNL